MEQEEPLLRRGPLFVFRVCMFFYALFFICVTMWHPLIPQPIFDSPDETANAFFIARVAASQPMGAPNRSVTILGDEGAPRSQRVVDGVLVPEGFPGLAYYWGILARYVSLTGVMYIVPMLGLIALYAWYGIVRFFFNQKIASLAFLLLGFFPPYIYWSSRVFMPNMPVLSCMLIGVWASLQAWKCRRFSLSLDCADEGGVDRENPHTRFSRVRGTAFLGLAGLAFGLAIAIRPSDLVWMTPVMIAAISTQVIRARWYTLVSVVVCGAVIAPVLYVHRELYGSFFASGYAHHALLQAQQSIFVNIRRYFGEGYGWLMITGVTGVMMAIITSLRYRGAHTFRVLLCVFLTATTAGALMLLYGGQPHQEFIPGIRFVSESHTRYFLPLYVMMTLWAAYAFSRLSTFASSALMRTTTPLIMLMLAGGVWGVLTSPGGIMFYKAAVERNGETRKSLLRIVGPDALVLGMHAEKFIFPLRSVSRYADDPRVVQRVAEEIKNRKTPVYIIDTVSPKDLSPTATLYASYGLRVALVQEVTPGLWVYNVDTNLL